MTIKSVYNEYIFGIFIINRAEADCMQPEQKLFAKIDNLQDVPFKRENHKPVFDSIQSLEKYRHCSNRRVSFVHVYFDHAIGRTIIEMEMSSK